MSLFHIALIGQGFIIPLIVAQCKPGGRNYIDSLCLGQQLLQNRIGGLQRDLMPYQRDLLVQRNILVHRRFKAADRFLRLKIRKPAARHIANVPVPCEHLGPSLHGFQHNHVLALNSVSDNRALHAAFDAHPAVFADHCHRNLIPSVLDKHALLFSAVVSVDPDIRIV